MSTARPLSGCVVGISISETEEMESLGFDRSELNRCVVRLSESLLAAGAHLAFGHDWRPGGVMEAVAALAVRYVDVHRDAQGRPRRGPAPIVNRVAPPDVPFLSQQQGEADGTHSPVNPMGRLLEGIVEARQSAAPLGASRAEALSFMREELSRLCHLRVCLGGKLRGFSGKIPGVMEEALGTLRAERAVLASAIFGGASRVIVRAMQGASDPGNFTEERTEIHRRAARMRRSLEEREEQRLWCSTSVEQCVELILRGAVKWWAGQQPR